MNEEINVLYVEDDPPSIQLMKEAFDESHVPTRVHALESGREAISFLSTLDTEGDVRRPDLVLLDLDLGETSGFDVLDALRASRALGATPAVVFTSSDDATDVAAAYDRGADAFVRKPHDLEGLIAFVDRATTFWGSVTNNREAAR